MANDDSAPQVLPVFAGDDIFAMMKAIFDARESDQECECAVPYNPTPTASLCLVCGRMSEVLERHAVIKMCAAHDFEPDSRHQIMCNRCSGWEDDPRHHGVHAVGRMRNGSQIRPEEWL